MNRNKIFAITLFVAIVGGLAVFVGLNRQFLTDQFLAWTYQAPSEVASIADSLKLTDNGKRIFYATQPAIEDNTNFNQHCRSHNVDVSVLGCYTDSRIYMYNVNNQELNGVKEATAAHELLHAVWARMSNDDRARIGKQLTDYYEKNKDQFSKEMSLYGDEERLDELHSRIGTEGKNLPDELKQHYGEIFNDQAKVVGYYEAYHGRFQELQAEAEKLHVAIDNLKAKIESQSSEYKTRTETLSKKITEFNQCANTMNCFSDHATFNAKRAELIAEQEALEKLYQEIEQNIKDCNSKISTYNANVFRTKTLQDSINSNSQPPKV